MAKRTDGIKFLTPKHPQVPPLRHDPGDRMKILFDMYYIFYLREHYVYDTINSL